MYILTPFSYPPRKQAFTTFRHRDTLYWTQGHAILAQRKRRRPRRRAIIRRSKSQILKLFSSSRKNEYETILTKTERCCCSTLAEGLEAPSKNTINVRLDKRRAGQLPNSSQKRPDMVFRADYIGCAQMLGYRYIVK